MRLKLSLLPMQNQQSIAVPINYNYPIHSAIYKLLAKVAPDYATWLHDHGYASENQRRMKMFVFSKLDIPRVRRVKRTLEGRSDQLWILHIASPMEDEFIQNFVLSLFEKQHIEIGGKQAVGRFQINSVEAIPEPTFKSSMRGKTCSPLIVSKRREDGSTHYLRVTDADLSSALRNNLVQKYQIAYNHPLHNTSFQIEFDSEYISRKGERIYKLITIKEGSREQTQYKGIEAPFSLTGTPELLQIAWHCGLGEKNAMGFGMVDLW